MTIGAQLDADGDLAKQFEEFRERNSFETKSEAVRALVRDSLERDRRQQQQRDIEQQSAQSGPDSAETNDAQQALNLIEGNEPILLGVALLIGFDGILSALTSVAGGVGAWLFIGLSLTVSAWIFVDVARSAGIGNRLSGDNDDSSPSAPAGD